MKPLINSLIPLLLMGIWMATRAAAQASDSLPSTSEVVAKMLEQDAARKAQLSGYTVMRHYVAINENAKAEMVVRMKCAGDGEKQFTILSESGSTAIRRHVFYKMLKEETEASSLRMSNKTRITPANYNFQLLGRDVIENNSTYLLRITPKDDSEYAIDGKIWVDANDYSIIRIEGNPARNPSYWTTNVHFLRTYRKVGPLWLAASTHSVSHIRLFGDAELTIDNLGYMLNPPDDHIAKADYPTNISQ
jgi:negative regulator of sigma E activity